MGELPGMWDESDLTGGATDCDPPPPVKPEQKLGSMCYCFNWRPLADGGRKCMDCGAVHAPGAE